MHDPELPDLWRVDDATPPATPGEIARGRVLGVLAGLALCAIFAGLAALAIATKGGA